MFYWGQEKIFSIRLHDNWCQFIVQFQAILSCFQHGKLYCEYWAFLWVMQCWSSEIIRLFQQTCIFWHCQLFFDCYNQPSFRRVSVSSGSWCRCWRVSVSLLLFAEYNWSTRPVSGRKWLQLCHESALALECSKCTWSSTDLISLIIRVLRTLDPVLDSLL
jgi:hypothetical protein